MTATCLRNYEDSPTSNTDSIKAFVGRLYTYREIEDWYGPAGPIIWKQRRALQGLGAATVTQNQKETKEFLAKKRKIETELGVTAVLCVEASTECSRRSKSTIATEHGLHQ